MWKVYLAYWAQVYNLTKVEFYLLNETTAHILIVFERNLYFLYVKYLPNSIYKTYLQDFQGDTSVFQAEILAVNNRIATIEI